MASENPVTKPKGSVTREQVREYLQSHPNFFKENAELLESLTPPEVDHGGNVVDLQHHMLAGMQKNMAGLRSKYDALLISSRDNMSTLHQVHEAALSLIRAPGLEQLLEFIAVDLPALFNVDIVRLGLESDAAEFYENKLAEEDASGLSFLSTGFIDETLGRDKSILLVADTSKQFISGFEQIFTNCSGIVDSAALLRMRLASSQRSVMLAFGVRIPGHFHEGQGTEMLSFLAQIVEHRLDECLNESGIAHLL